MILRRLVLLLAAAALIAPATSRAEIGDLEFRACAELSFAFLAMGCPVVDDPPVSETPVFSPDGVHAYTASRGVVAQHTRNSDGTLTFVRCVGQAGAAHSCASSAAGIFGFGQQLMTNGMVVSPDGLEVFVATNLGTNGGTLTHFNRDPATGALTFGSCMSQVAGDHGCTTTRSNLLSVHDMVVVTKGATRHLYVSAQGILHFTLTADGTPTYTSCHGGAAGCIGPVKETSSPGLAVTPDGADLYAAGQALQHFKIQNDGSLTPTGCFAAFAGGHLGCSTALAVFAGGAFGGVALSPDGTSLYIAGSSLFVFDRAPSGALTYDTCLGDLGSTTCTGFRGLGSLRSAAVSPDGKWVYTAGESLSIFQRASSGTLTRVRCIQGIYARAGCTRAGYGLDTNGNTLVLGPGGTHVYTGNLYATAIFTRVEYVPAPPLATTPLDERVPGQPVVRSMVALPRLPEVRADVDLGVERLSALREEIERAAAARPAPKPAARRARKRSSAPRRGARTPRRGVPRRIRAARR